MTDSTNELLEKIKNTKDINTWLQTNSESIPDVTLAEYLTMILKEKNLKKSEVVKKSGIEKTYIYQIFRGEKTNPSRDKILMIALGMGLELNETQKLLRIAKCGELYPKDNRDCVIIWGIFNGKSVIDINIVLFDAGFEPLT